MTNSLFNRLYKKIETGEHTLLYLFLEITRKCNLNCLHCGSDCQSSPAQGELTTDSWKKIVHYIHDHFSQELVFVITGGEPLLHPALEEIGHTIRELGMRWGMVTNGMLLTSSKLKALIKAGLYSLTLSLDGLESAHNKLRNHPRAFHHTLDALKAAGAADLPCKDVVTCVYPDNRHELDAVADLLIYYGIPAWRLFRIFPSGRAAGNRQLLLDFLQTRELLSWIAGRRKLLKKQGLKVNYCCEGYLPPAVDKMVRDTPFFCRAGINIASILADGTITGCSNNDSGFYEGNILKDSFAFLWEQRFRKFRQKEWLQDTQCGSCNCRRDCLGSSIHLWKNGKDRPEFCYVHKQ